MNRTQSRFILNHRDLFRLLGVAGIVTLGGYALFETAPWLNSDLQAIKIRQLLEQDSATSAPMRELVRYATLAASGHNTQPWTFAVTQNAIDIHPDYTRRLPAVDPDDRELWISLGCALENLLVAARAVGYAPEVTIYAPAWSGDYRFPQDLRGNPISPVNCRVIRSDSSTSTNPSVIRVSPVLSTPAVTPQLLLITMDVALHRFTSFMRNIKSMEQRYL